MKGLRLVIGADHGGFALKNELLSRLKDRFEINDLGAHSLNPSDDYPDLAYPVAEAVASGKADRGILICGSGVGASIAANKVPGVRACLCHDTYSAHQGVEHDDMNILCIGAWVVAAEMAYELVDTFLNARFSGEDRHRRRLQKIVATERRGLGSPGLASGGPAEVQTNLGESTEIVKASLADLTATDAAKRIWRRDYTVWKPESAEIGNRLGWLTVTETMHEQVTPLQSFARDIAHAGFRHVVLLGMGGSSLCAEVFRQVFGSAQGFPRLIVLDSTVPTTVRSVSNDIAPSHTLFLVSSKSGTTIEPNLFFRFFKEQVARSGKRNPADNFIAITDPGTPLSVLAEKEGVRKVFLDPPDIGGRYSALSYFGLVPAALMGLDISLLLDRAEGVQQACASSAPSQENPGLWLGACLASLASKGRDKLTLITSPSIKSFGLWVEQLIAESTGKEGKGIVPITGEPLVSPEYYGADLLFVYLRLKTDDNKSTDAALNALEASGQPAIVLDMKDKLALGAEFFRWEFATAVAGRIIGINPFDQPNVQAAKDASVRLLEDYVKSAHLPPMQTSGSLQDLLSQVRTGDYLAVMAYVQQTPETDRAIAGLRRNVIEEHHIATTLGYGPRFLHSTGQLHKGGPNSGLFLQLTEKHPQDLPIPGEPYSFGVVADAEALGDLQALQGLGRRVVTLCLESDDPASLEALTQKSRVRS